MIGSVVSSFQHVKTRYSRAGQQAGGRRGLGMERTVILTAMIHKMRTGVGRGTGPGKNSNAELCGGHLDICSHPPNLDVF